MTKNDYCRSLNRLDLKVKEGDIDKDTIDQIIDDKVIDDAKHDERGDIEKKVDSNGVGSSQKIESKVANQSPLYVINATYGKSDCVGKSSSKKSPRSKLKLRSCKLGQNSPQKHFTGLKTKIGCNSGAKKLKSAKKEVKKDKIVDKNDKSLSVKKIKTLKNYFESLSNRHLKIDTHDEPVNGNSAKIDSKDDDDDTSTKVNTKEETVKVRVDAFEKLMRSSGGTRQKTPRKKVRRIGDGKKI